MRTDKPPEHTDTAWKRISEELIILPEEDPHIHEECERCTLSPQSNISPYAHGFLDTRNVPSLSGYNAVLVVSLHEYKRQQYKTDACVFALGEMQELVGNTGLSTMIEDLLQRGLIYHTIMSAVNDVSPTFDFRGNLSLPYRAVTSEERYRLENWIKELRDEPLSTSTMDRRQGHLAESHEIKSTYRLMYLLGIGHSEEEATALSAINWSQWDFAVDTEKSPSDPLVFKKIKLRGEKIAQRFASWDEGKEFLKREHPEQISFVESISVNTSREVIVLD
jgi:hypothetical protein